jgi:hypothetical protein
VSAVLFVYCRLIVKQIKVLPNVMFVSRTCVQFEGTCVLKEYLLVLLCPSACM